MMMMGMVTMKTMMIVQVWRTPMTRGRLTDRDFRAPVDERLVSVDPSLLLTLQDADSLLGWLRLTPNDNDFISSIDSSMTKG